MDLSLSSWGLLLAVCGAVLALIPLWMMAGELRERDALECASNSRLPVSIRVRALEWLGSTRLLAGHLRRNPRVSQLLADLQTYDRNPLIRQAAAAALQRLLTDADRRSLA